MPSLLVRVGEEDRLRCDNARQEVQDGGEWIDGLTHDGMKGRGMEYRLGGDVRARLGALVPGMESFEGWMRLQRLETFYCMGIVSVTDQSEKEHHGALSGQEVIRQRPKTTTFRFFDPDHDTSIESFLINLELADDDCAWSGCEAKRHAHTRWWIHAGKNIGLRIEQGEDPVEGTEVWVKCAECQRESTPRRMSDISGFVPAE